MALLKHSIPVETLKNAEVEAILADLPDAEYSDYMDEFGKRAKEEANEEKKTVYRFMASLCSLRLHPESIDEPYVPFMIMQDSRSASLGDIETPEIETLDALLSLSLPSDLRARIADILWIKRNPRNYQDAITAINSFLDSSNRFGTRLHEVYLLNLVARALRLAISLGKGNPEIRKTIDRIEEFVDQYGGKDPIITGVKLLEILISNRCCDADKHRPLLKHYAQLAKAEKKQLIELHCWDLYAQLSNIMQVESGRAEAYVEMGTCHEREAEDALKDGRGYIGAAHFIRQAIEAYRRAGHQEVKIKELRATLLDYESKTRDEMQAIETEFDAKELADKAEEYVSGYPFQEAMIRLASMGGIVSVDELERQVRDIAEKAPLQYIMSSIGVDSRGRIISIKPSPFTDAPDQQKLAMQAEMWNKGQFNQHFHYQSMIQYARMKIIAEHHVSIQDMALVVANTPFIPEERRVVYARGLLAGLQGDFIVAAHLLIPQLENSLRHVLNLNGIETTTLDQHGIQLEKSLNDLFVDFEESLNRVFGKNMVFLLRGLLVERHGSNLRNRLSHGLMEDGEFFTSSVGYLWWITLRLCLAHQINAYFREVEEESLTGDDEEEETGQEQ